MKRTWIKLYAHQWLFGTLRDELEPAERSIWADFLAMAGDSNWEGQISFTKTMGYTDFQISGLLKVPLQTLKSAKEKMIKHGKITVTEDNVIEICKWFIYQSEYLRQKPYRQKAKKLQGIVTSESDTLDIDKDKEQDIEEEIIKPLIKKTRYRAIKGHLSNEINATDIQTAYSACKYNDPDLTIEDIDQEFNQLWKNFPGDSTTKGNKMEANGLYRGLRKKIYAEVLAAGFNGYCDLIRHKKVNQNFNQNPMNVARFLRKGNWLVNICFKFQAKL